MKHIVRFAPNFLEKFYCGIKIAPEKFQGLYLRTQQLLGSFCAVHTAYLTDHSDLIVNLWFSHMYFIFACSFSCYVSTVSSMEQGPTYCYVFIEHLAQWGSDPSLGPLGTTSKQFTVLPTLWIAIFSVFLKASAPEVIGIYQNLRFNLEHKVSF